MGRVAPAPGLEGVAGPFVEVALHGDAAGGVRIEVHHGVVVGNVLATKTNHPSGLFCVFADSTFFRKKTTRERQSADALLLRRAIHAERRLSSELNAGEGSFSPLVPRGVSGGKPFF